MLPITLTSSASAGLNRDCEPPPIPPQYPPIPCGATLPVVRVLTQGPRGLGHDSLSILLQDPPREDSVTLVDILFRFTHKISHSLDPHSATRLLRFATKPASRRLGSSPLGFLPERNKTEATRFGFGVWWTSALIL